MKIKKKRSIYRCWCASPSQPGSSANMSNPAILVQPSIIPSQNTRLFLCGAPNSAAAGPLPSFHFPLQLFGGSDCQSVFPVTTPVVPSSAVSPNLPFVYQSKTWRLTPAGVCSAVVPVVGADGTLSSFDCFGESGGGLTGVAVWDRFPHVVWP